MLMRRPYVIRKQTPNSGKEVSVPPYCPMEPGDKVIVLSDGFLGVVPEDAKVDEAMLRQAIRLQGK
jgi:hypothetical protein